MRVALSRHNTQSTQSRSPLLAFIVCNQIKLVSACLMQQVLLGTRPNVMLMQSLAKCSGKLHIPCCTVVLLLLQATASHCRGLEYSDFISAYIPPKGRIRQSGNASQLQRRSSEPRTLKQRSAGKLSARPNVLVRPKLKAASAHKQSITG